METKTFKKFMYMITTVNLIILIINSIVFGYIIFYIPSILTSSEIYEDDGTLTFKGIYGHTPNPNLTEDRPAIRLHSKYNDSKPIIEWRDEDNQKVAWIVAHDKLYEDSTYKDHKHISIETVKSDMNTVITRLQVTYGTDVAKVIISNSDFLVSDNGIQFSRDQDTKIWRYGENEMRLSAGGISQISVKKDSVEVMTGLILPKQKPKSPVVGSVYFDEILNQTMCYNGKEFNQC